MMINILIIWYNLIHWYENTIKIGNFISNWKSNMIHHSNQRLHCSEIWEVHTILDSFFSKTAVICAYFWPPKHVQIKILLGVILQERAPMIHMSPTSTNTDPNSTKCILLTENFKW